MVSVRNCISLSVQQDNGTIRSSHSVFLLRLALALIFNIAGFVPVLAVDKLLPAFPTAEGFGAFTPGGRGGKVYVVTTLEDYNSKIGEKPISGSFREAIEAKGPRIVVFRVSGTIKGRIPFLIKHPYITIAGQTSPGGICVSNLSILTHDVVVRFLRIRSHMGDPAGGVAQDSIIDHCSLSWGSDEIISFKDHSNNVTIQWNLICDGPLPHSMGSIIDGLQGITLHHNLYAHLWYRTPRINGKAGFVEDIRNNVIYNFGGEPTYPGAPGIFINIVGNYYKPGPSTPLEPGISGYVQGRPILLIDGLKAFIEGNYYCGREDLSSDNWKMVNPHIYSVRGDYDPRAYKTMTLEQVQEAASKYRDTLVKNIKTDKEVPHGTVKTDMAQQAYEKVLKNVGAYLPFRDRIDSNAVGDVRNSTGVIKTRDQLGKYPEMNSQATVPDDKDMDGMSDEWERLNKLNPEDASDAAKDNDNDGYTNIEEYLNFLAEDTHDGGTNPDKPFEWVYSPHIVSKDSMYFGRDTGLKDWLQCFGDFRLELPVKFIGSTTVVIESPDKDAEIRYSLDGSQPSSSSKLYTGPITITGDAMVRAKAFKAGRESFEVFKRFIACTPQKAESVSTDELEKGLLFKLVKMSTDMKAIDVLEMKQVSEPHLPASKSESEIVYDGFINIPKDGIYKFNFVYPSGKMDRDDYCAVKIADRIVLCTHKDSGHTVTDTIALQAGLHKIEIIYKTYEYHRVDFYWQGPGIKEQKTPADIFFRVKD